MVERILPSDPIKHALLTGFRFSVAMAVFHMSPALAQDELPDGPGKDDVVAHCIGCHGSDRILSHRMTADQWSYTVNSMIGLGANVPDPDKIIRYLATNYGQSTATPPLATPSTTDITAASPPPSSSEGTPPGAGAPPQ